MSSHSRAVIRIQAQNIPSSSINYSRRMYAIIRRYTSEAVEGAHNECFAELTGLRTFFKMSYNELAEAITHDIYKDTGVRCAVSVSSVKIFESLLKSSKKPRTVATYKEIHNLILGESLKTLSNADQGRHPRLIKKIRLTVPFIGKVS